MIRVRVRVITRVRVVIRFSIIETNNMAHLLVVQKAVPLVGM